MGMFGSIIVTTPGCTNSEATNYNVEATQDDGSCEFNIASSIQVTTCGGMFVGHETCSDGASYR